MYLKYKNIVSIDNVLTIFRKAWHTFTTDTDALLRKMDKLSHFVRVENSADTIQYCRTVAVEASVLGNVFFKYK